VSISKFTNKASRELQAEYVSS